MITTRKGAATILVMTSLVLPACRARVVPPYEAPPPPPRLVIQRNYELNKTMRQSVGGAMVQVRDYCETTQPSQSPQLVRADSDLTLTHETFTGSTTTFGIRSGGIYQVLGTADLDETAYRVVVINTLQTSLFGAAASFNYTGGRPGVLIDANGNMVPDVLVGIGGRVFTFGEEMNRNGLLTPSSAKAVNFQKVAPPRSSSTRTAGFQNFELLFSGRDRSALRILYREYTPDDGTGGGIARSAFFQELTFPPDTKIVRFKEMTIEVLSVTSGEIVYRVTSEIPRPSDCR